MMALIMGLAGCGLFDPCGDDTHTCGTARIHLPTLDPSLAGAVQLTISRQDLPSETVTCRWQALASSDAGATAAGWSCDPSPDQSDSSTVTYSHLLVEETAYQLVLVGPGGTAAMSIDQDAITPGDACGCVVGDFQIPNSVWTQVGAL